MINKYYVIITDTLIVPAWGRAQWRTQCLTVQLNQWHEAENNKLLDEGLTAAFDLRTLYSVRDKYIKKTSLSLYQNKLYKFQKLID